MGNPETSKSLWPNRSSVNILAIPRVVLASVWLGALLGLKPKEAPPEVGRNPFSFSQQCAISVRTGQKTADLGDSQEHSAKHVALAPVRQHPPFIGAASFPA